MDILENGGGNHQSVADFYSNQSIFVTGGTGFLGKAFIEKILYSCPKISKIFILLREKKNMSVDERTQKMFDLPIFNRIKKERPENFKKVVPISGDITLPNLGIKPEDEEMLAKEVSMVFHIAAIIKFQEPLPVALDINYKGTKRVLDLCCRVKNLKAFVYVSTAFTNSNKEFMEEVVYPPPIPLEEAEILADRTFFSEKETAAILNDRINTYTFTKELAESLVAKYCGTFPSAIVRPSIVLSSKSEPVTGWVDNWYGATGVMLPIGQGFNRVMLTDRQFNIDLIPLDYVVNTIIVAATQCKRSRNIAVYNSSSSGENPITIGNFIRLFIKECVIQKIHIFPFPKVYFTLSIWMLKLLWYVQRLPAILGDCCLFVIGKQPRLVKYQNKSLQAQQVTECFTKRTWRISAKQTCALYSSLSETDKKRFNFDPRNITWEEFIPTYVRGIIKYLWKNTASQVEK